MQQKKGEQKKRVGFLQGQWSQTQLLGRGSGEEEVKDVEVPLPVQRPDHTGFLEEVVGDAPTNGVTLEVKFNLHVLSEATAVVVPQSLGISKG